MGKPTKTQIWRVRVLGASWETGSERKQAEGTSEAEEGCLIGSASFFAA